MSSSSGLLPRNPRETRRGGPGELKVREEQDFLDEKKEEDDQRQVMRVYEERDVVRGPATGYLISSLFLSLAIKGASSVPALLLLGHVYASSKYPSLVTKLG